MVACVGAFVDPIQDYLTIGYYVVKASLCFSVPVLEGFLTIHYGLSSGFFSQFIIPVLVLYLVRVPVANGNPL